MMKVSGRVREAIGMVLAAASIFGAGWSHAASIVVKPLIAASAGQTLVTTLLGPGTSIAVVPGSIQYTGAPSASGLFVVTGSAGLGTLGMTNGIILTTGDARFVSGSATSSDDLANKTTALTSGIGNALTRNTSPGNALFAGLTPAPTFSASILSFQFIPPGNSITLKYVFGSDEYSDVVNTGLPGDVLGIFVNGVNYAVVPGTSTPVSTASINCGGPTSGTASNANAPNCTLYRDNPPFFGTIDTELDGLTVVLTLTAPVIAGKVNTIQLGIANAFDSFVDSAVFIQAGSLQSNE
jgi:hypothetical protein